MQVCVRSLSVYARVCVFRVEGEFLRVCVCVRVCGRGGELYRGVNVGYQAGGKGSVFRFFFVSHLLFFGVTSSPVQFNSPAETLRRAIANTLRGKRERVQKKRTREISLTSVSG